MRSISSDLLATSSICVAELRYGAARHPQGEVLWERISQDVLPRVEIVPLGLPEAERAGDLIAILEARGLVIGIEDVLIGATGLVHQRTMVTRNVDHFARIDGLGYRELVGLGSTRRSCGWREGTPEAGRRRGLACAVTRPRARPAPP